MIERERKLALPGRFSVPALQVDGDALAVESLPDQTLRATYYDTPDLRLARHGVTLRYRAGDGRATWTLKLPARATGSELARKELHFDGPRHEPPPDARSLVTAYARREPLTAVATLRTRRRRLRLLRDSLPLAEIDDDEVSVVEGRRVVSRFRELEIEALADDLDLDLIAGQLRSAGATDAEPIPKVVRALGSRATAPADVSLARPDAVRSMGDVVKVALADALHRLVHHDPLARMGDVEGIHQVRVALRRLRSDLRSLGSAVDSGWRDEIEPRLRAIGAALADARDLDVLLERLHADAEGAEDVIAPLFAGLETRRDDAGRALRAALDDETYTALLDALIEAVADPPLGPGAGAPVSDAMPAAVAAAWQRLARRAKRLRPTSPDADFHRARIAAKRTRYAAELAARVLPSKPAAAAARFAQKVSVAQDRLGAAQDAAVAEGVIRAALEERPSDSAYAFEAGRLVERQRMRAADARSGFLDLWPGLRRRRWRSWAG